MKRLSRFLLLITALAVLVPAAVRPVDILQQCSTVCSCRTNCGTPCRQSDGTPSACGLNRNICNASPICFEP